MSTFLKLRRVSFIVFLSLTYMLAKGQQSMSIGDSQVKNSAVLYLKGNGNQGLIIPITTSAPTATFGEAGMIVYSSNEKSVYFHNGTSWVDVGGSSSSGGGNYTLSLTGNDFILKDGSTVKSTVPLASAPAAGQFLMWDGAKWAATSVSQDIANAAGVITVNGLKGKALPALPATGGTQILIYDTSTSTWKFQAITSGGTVTSVATGTGLTGGPITTSGTLSVDVGTTANKIVQLDATGKLPAVNGSALTSLPDPSSTNEIQNLSTAGTGTIAASESFDVAITSGTGIKIKEGSNIQIDQLANVLTINSIGGSGTVTSVATGTGLTGGPITTTGTLSVDVGTTANKIVQLDAAGKLPAVNGSALTSLPDPSSTNEIQNLSTAGTGTIAASESFDVAITSGTGIKIKEGTNIQIDQLSNVLTINSTGGSGTVTSVALSLPTIFSVSGSPITTSGTLTATLSNQTANTFFAAPSGSTGTPTFRTIVAADIPALDAAKITTGLLPVSVGGTGKNTWNGLLYGTGATLGDITNGTAGQYLKIAGTTPTWSTLSIVDADVNTAAAIAGAKINPAFGAQSISSGATSQFTVDNTGNITKINNVATSFPASQGSASSVLTNDGSGTLSWNVFSGSSLISNPGTSNIFAGVGAGAANSTGFTNSFFGVDAGKVNDTGTENTFIGSRAGVANTSGSYNVFVGKFAGTVNTTSNLNTYVGYQSGHLATGAGNSFFGRLSGDLTSTGGLNTFVGNMAGQTNTNGSNNTALGTSADVGSGGLTNATAIGANALVSTSNSVVLGNNANVGIGSASPVAKLHINNAAAVNTFTQFTNGGTGTTVTDGFQVGLNATSQAIINNQEATDLIVQSNSVPALWMNSSGKIGMRGAPDPGYNFLAYGVNPAFGLDNTGIKIGDVLGNSFGNYFYTDFEATPKFAFMGANVGIGTLTPGNALHVTPNSTTFAIRIDQGVNGDGFLSYVNTTSAARTIFSAQSNTSGLVVLGNGAVGIGTGAPTSKLSVSGSADKTGGGTWGTFSDRRVKKDIRSFTDGLGVLMKINPVQFKYNGLAGYSVDGKDYVGIIAQDLLPVAPYMISSVRKKLNETDSEETDILKYDGSALTYVLVNSIQEQQKQIEELKGIIQDLQAKLSQYESKEQSELVSIKEQIKKLNQALGLEAKANTK